MAQATPTSDSVLQTLTKARLASIGREFGVSIPDAATNAQQVELFQRVNPIPLGELVGWLQRDELKAACRAHGISDIGRGRDELSTRLLLAAGIETSPPVSAPQRSAFDLPQVGDVAHVRNRQYLVEGVNPIPGQMTRVDLVCLDDDNQGRSTSVLWDLELGARVMQPASHGLGQATKLDAPRHFAAYLHALKWNSVTATDAKLFQSPFRAGVRIMNHQLTPLRKALELPRANLFIADDVGLGKTIEAGLILQELLLRQRVEFALIVAPASVALQWRDEMQKRFGLAFEIYNRRFLDRRRQERGFAVNPWSTHNRFIITYQTLRRPEYRDPLLAHLGERIRKSVLILDEAHTAAPASASRYAIDSRVTKVVRDVAPRFENRLFLSATPHNGHSNSFSALLEILDPQRFTRGIPVKSRAQLEPVMVRRLKVDLRELGAEQFPVRKVIQVDVRNSDGRWVATHGSEKPTEVGTGEPVEIRLAELLRKYIQLAAPKGRVGRIVFETLQKRLLSSVEAFARTLRLHSEGRGSAITRAAEPELDNSDDEYGVDDETLDLALDELVATASGDFERKTGADLLAEMMALANQSRADPDGKLLSLLAWVAENQCVGIRTAATGKAAKWSDRRVIIFTEYADTKRYLHNALTAAAEGTDRGDERIMVLHGGMSDEQREEVQRAFNGDPAEYPVRILIATDAAREGVNLQGYCADLFHYDIPWNPARMEQRNGRIDRTLQPSSEVRCHYFFYPQRTEDTVLKKLVLKVDTIQRELGSLGAVVMEQMAKALEGGIDTSTGDKLADAEKVPDKAVVEAELESQRVRSQLKAEIDEAGRILNDSRNVMEFAPALLRDALDVGLEFSDAKPLKRGDPFEGQNSFVLPDLPPSWDETLDTLRPPKSRDETFWDWRRKKPLPVVFEPPKTMTGDVVHLHLQHPFVRRLLTRFLSQGYSSHDLGRVTVVPTANDSLVRVIAFGRLSLFGPGAVRLHDELVSVAAQWLEAGGPKHLKPFADAADRKAIATLEEVLQKSPALAVGKKVQERLLKSAPTDFAELWKTIEQEADAKAEVAKQRLRGRAEAESAALSAILQAQQASILEVVNGQMTLDFGDSENDRAQLRQVEEDRKHMRGRLEAIDKELVSEPAAIADLYRVVLMRVEPVGLIYLWPETRGS